MTRNIKAALRLVVGVAGVGLGGFLGGSLSGISVQAAEPSASFHTKSAWQVSKPAPQQCVLHNTFDNGFVMRISGSNLGADNVDYLSIDFLQSVFAQAQSYPVNVSVPGLVSKKIDALAEDTRVLQIGMRGRSDVMNAMESTGAFDLTLDSNHFRFYMTGLSAGIKKFDACTRGLTMRPALETAATAPVLRQEPRLPEPVYEPMELKRDPRIVPIQEILPEGMVSNIEEIDLSTPPFTGPKVSAPVRLGKSERPDAGGRAYLDRMRNNEYGDMKSPSRSAASVEGVYAPEDVSSARPDVMGGMGIPMPVSSSAPADLPTLNGGEVDVEVSAAVPVVETSPAPAPAKSSVPPRVRPQSAYSDMPDPLRATYTRERISAQADFAADADRKMEQAAAAANEPFANTTKYERLSTGKKKKKTRSDVSASTLPAMGAGTSSGGYMNEKVSDLSRKLEALEEKNAALGRELQDAYRATEKERLVISSENWDLERATMRFNEAERQIDSLGRQLQRQKIQYESEKAKLEEMLFDPSLTESSQIAELARIEAENAALKAKLRAMGGAQ